MKQSFVISYLTFYLKASIGLENNVIKTSNPNTILKLIPLGSKNKTIPVNQIASVDDSFSLDFKSFVWGIIFFFVGLNGFEDSFFQGLFWLAYGVLTILSSFQTILSLHLTSGGVHELSVIVFEKAKLLTYKEEIEAVIQQHNDDRNFAKHSQNQTEQLVDALKNK